jgi:hypothetical protein
MRMVAPTPVSRSASISTACEPVTPAPAQATRAPGAATTAPFINDTLAINFACGRLTFLLQLSGYDGRPDDPHVSVAVAPSFGIVGAARGRRGPRRGSSLHNGITGPIPPERFPDPATIYTNLVQIPPLRDRTDRWSVPAAYRNSNSALTSVFPGHVTQHRLVVEFDGESDQSPGWPVVFDTQPIQFRTAILSAELVPNGNGFRLEDGLLTARAKVDDLLTAASKFRTEQKQYFCHNAVYGALKGVLCSSADLAAFKTDDFKWTTSRREAGANGRALAPVLRGAGARRHHRRGAAGGGARHMPPRTSAICARSNEPSSAP